MSVQAIGPGGFSSEARRRVIEAFKLQEGQALTVAVSGLLRVLAEQQ